MCLNYFDVRGLCFTNIWWLLSLLSCCGCQIMSWGHKPPAPSLPSPYHVFDLDPLLDHQSVPLLGLAVYYNVPECCLPKNWCVTEAAGHGRNCVLPSAGRWVSLHLRCMPFAPPPPPPPPLPFFSLPLSVWNCRWVCGKLHAEIMHFFVYCVGVGVHVHTFMHE